MRTNIFSGLQIVVFFFLAFLQISKAQSNLNESGKIIRNKPMDDIYVSKVNERLPIMNNYIDERDVLWEKRIWREIDVKELQNQHFAFDKNPLVSILLDAVNKGNLTAYDINDDQFSKCMSTEELNSKLYRIDTVTMEDFSADTFKQVVLVSNFNPKSVLRYRVKEVVYFDSKLSRYKSRILGIAPIMNHYDINGNFLASFPICWFYYDDLRSILAKESTFNRNTDTKNLSWVDILDSGFFSGRITKESNVNDVRIQDIFSGIKILYESQNVHENNRNIEADFISNH